MTTRRKDVLLLAPSTGVFLACFVVPLGYFFVLSFYRVVSYQLQPAFTAENYVTVWTDYLASVSFTFSIAIVIAIFVTAIGFGFAYYVRFRAGRFGLALLFVALITLFAGYLTKIYVWKTILGQTGVFNAALVALGLIDEPVRLFLYNPAAVVISLGHYLLPLAILPIYGSLRNVADTPLRGARDLGASPWRVFRDIVLPQVRIGILFAFALSFLFAAGDYVTPLLVGGPHTSMLGVLIQLQFGMRFNAPVGSAMAFTAIAICVFVIAAFDAILRQALRVR